MRKYLVFYVSLFVLFVVAVHTAAQTTNYPMLKSRDALQWPFSQNSIWNMPIGDSAVYVHAKLMPAKKSCTVDEDYIVLTPNAPKVDIYFSDAGWDRTKSRCNPSGAVFMSVPIPHDFVVSPSTWHGITPNAGLAVLMEDGKTIRQTQPFARCEAGGQATSLTKTLPDQDITKDDGIQGAHGGSGLSAIGGALRIGELMKGSGPIRHALKVNVFAAKNLYYDNETKGCRWPALRADNYAAKQYYTKRQGDIVKDCRMGALLAIPPTITLQSLQLETEPGLILARAMQDFGAYIADDTAWDVYGICAEWGPNGRFTDEFKKSWGFDFEADSSTAWGRDVAKIFEVLHVVVNNSATSIGGGGKRRAPLAPAFTKK